MLATVFIICWKSTKYILDYFIHPEATDAGMHMILLPYGDYWQESKLMWWRYVVHKKKHMCVLPIMVSIYLFIFVCWQKVISLRIHQLRTPSWPWRSHLFLPDSEAGWSGSPLHVIQFLANSKYTSVTTPLEEGKKGRLRTTQSFRNKPRHVSWSSYPGNCRWWP